LGDTLDSMTTRRALSDLSRRAQEFLFYRTERMTSEREEKEAKDWLKPYILEHGIEDGSGHKTREFAPPLNISGHTYTGITARKSVVPYIKTDEVEEYLSAHGLLDEIRVEVPATFYYDYEEIYRLNQEGKIPDDVIDTLEDNRVTWSLWPREE
jgi:hypothetical protein